MAELDLVKTGISGLDAILSSGIPRGNVILLEGGIGTGKTTMGVEFVYRGASMFGEPGIIVLFEVSPDKLVRDAACFGWDLPALERQRKLKIIFTTRQVFRQELQQADSLLLEEAAEIGARRIFVDGVAGVASAVGGAEPRDAFHVLVEGLQRENLTAVFAVEASALDADRAIALPEESIADTVIRLRMEERFRATVRSIEIVKSRGHDFQMGRHSFRIVDGHGHRGVPAGAGPSPGEPRPRRGLRSDDARVHRRARPRCGGERWLLPRQHDGRRRDLGRRQERHGPAVHRRRGAARRAQPHAHAGRAGRRRSSATPTASGSISQAHIDSGLVRLQYDAPQEMEIDRHFHNIEQLVEEFKPKRVLIDSLSTYGANLGTGGRDVSRLLSRARRADEGAPDGGGVQPREPGDAGDVVDDGRFRHELARGQHPSHELD